MLPFSKSTSGLVLPKRNDGPLPSISEVPPKRPSSTEGRFVILDKKTKPWSYSSSDSSSDEGEPVAGHSGMKFTWPKTPAASAVTVPPAPAPKKMATGGSRFRIVPVESRYHRGRWDCYDYYDKPSYPTSSKMSCPPPLTDIPINGNRSRSGPRTAPPMRTASFGFDIPPPVVSVPSTAPQSKTEQQNPQHTQDNNNIQRKQATANPLSHTQRDHNNKYTPSEVLQNGLETTLSKEVAVAEPKKVVYRERPSPSNYTTSSSATTPQMVAIDSKIEQAMDLVKTHLMFAVREEVEVLRARIVDLEHHVVHLETENSVLRDHIPQDVLQKLSSH